MKNNIQFRDVFYCHAYHIHHLYNFLKLYINIRLNTILFYFIFYFLDLILFYKFLKNNLICSRVFIKSFIT